MTETAEATTTDCRTWPVGRVATWNPVTIRSHEDLWSALRLVLTTGLRHLVVVDDAGRYRGILVDRYVMAEWPSDAITARATTVSKIVGEPAPTLVPDDTLAYAARAMLEAGCDALVVVDELYRPTGIVTGSDLLRALVESEALAS